MSSPSRPGLLREERPLLVTAGGSVGIVLGLLALLRGSILFLFLLAAGFDVPGREFGLILLIPAGAVVLIGAIDALRGGAVRLLAGAAWALLGVDVLNGTTYVLADQGFSAIDFLSAVMTAVLVFVLLQPQVRRHAATFRR